MFLWLTSSFILIFGSLLSVAFMTLLERKILSLTQIRLGPNKMAWEGVMQPIFDGMKLILKKNLLLVMKQMSVFLGPLLLFVLVLSMLTILPWFWFFLSLKFSLVIFFCLVASISYGSMLIGWGAISIFSKLGSMRGILQTLALEVSLVIFFLVSFCFNSGLNLFMEKITLEQMFLWVLMLLILVLTDCNRAPMDLLEGESELISGFNLELGSILFIFVFLSEYGMMIFFSLLGGLGIFFKISFISFFFLSYCMLFIRSCFARFRYDQLLYFMWKDFLPLSIYYFIFFNV